MGKQATYRCSECGESTPRAGLVTKKAMFQEMGEGARTILSRVVAWLCADCLIKDSEYNLPAYSSPYSPNRAGATRDASE